jgi:hypothetical protein
MPPIPSEQRPSYGHLASGERSSPQLAVPAPTIPHHHQRHGDRASGDDDAGDDPRRRLTPWVRYTDLVEANIVGSWTQLLRLIDYEGFPVGAMLSPNIRAWRLDHIEEWLASRPTARKIPPPTRKPRGRKRAVEAATDDGN